MGSNPTSAQAPVIIRPVNPLDDLEHVRACFKEYIEWLNEDISFQDYEQEFSQLPGKYAPPTGALLLAADGSSGDILGCIALRPLQLQGEYANSRQGTVRHCELKRLYVYPKARGRQVARQLIQEAVRCARQIGYDEVLLDTLPRMLPAVTLYKSEGFRETNPYYYNPLDGVLYFSKHLGVVKAS